MNPRHSQYRLRCPGSLLASLLVVILSACSTPRAIQDAALTEPPPTFASLARGVSVQLPGLDPHLSGLSANQLVAVQYGNKHEQFLATFEAAPQQFALAALTPLGVPLLNLNYDGRQLTSDSSGLTKLPFAPENLLLDLMLCYWSSAQIEQMLLANGLRLYETALQRQIWDRGSLLIQIDYQTPTRLQGPVTYVHFQRDYQLAIDTLDWHQQEAPYEP
ncbi:DUF3261 domain-containing protein [Aestuariirhabdus sp. Z084]|uniref:DUF3261 domain-containing protein n=1 Tax=Aestuariirhabdus haliotis TaxID=2918751 RepID=UPI00201B3AF2|nr:DUF3261 domain-containing protein [Aestuariirhabdus haliotis]MCL6414058.1 DUF3261 domain-containing protein [Aestuariirhabdus haliotis]MCL6417991.1 DUF3261 domain-containing protein [Aestuariirhabdus haliotis]